MKRTMLALSALGILSAGTVGGVLPTTAYAATSSHSTTAVKYPGHLIEMGSRGTYVKEVQQQLNKLGYSCGTADSIFGSKTLKAVKAFQKAHHLTVDGVVGLSTWTALFGSSPEASTKPKTIVNPYQTYTYNKMVQDIQSLTRKYPDLVHSEVVGRTVYGRDIYAVSIGKGKPTAFINGAHHAREWITTVLNMYMIDQYAQAYEKGQSIGGYNVRNVLNNATIWFIPMVNPDGVTLEQSGLSAFPRSSWKKLISWNGGSSNFKRWKANAQGIDPNLQYDGGWADIRYDLVNHPSYEDYKGPKPYYINEVKAVLKLINQINPQDEVAYHSSGRVIYWGYKLSRSQESTDYWYATKVKSMTGYYIEPIGASGGGGLTDWWTHNVGRPGLTVEVGTYVGDQPVPLDQFSTIWNQNKAVGLFMAQQAISLYKQHPSSVVRVNY
ncbi:MAG: peptidoglycan-binding protein [Alicyclobacillus shizuokensis]|nr:peptidoglycan-binding protein [Alicyclobacillus shizuokensis]